jgi:hypothetical protein
MQTEKQEYNWKLGLRSSTNDTIVILNGRSKGKVTVTVNRLVSWRRPGGKAAAVRCRIGGPMLYGPTAYMVSVGKPEGKRAI